MPDLSPEDFRNLNRSPVQPSHVIADPESLNSVFLLLFDISG
jgi:hypothetical protein